MRKIGKMRYMTLCVVILMVTTTASFYFSLAIVTDLALSSSNDTWLVVIAGITAWYLPAVVLGLVAVMTANRLLLRDIAECCSASYPDGVYIADPDWTVDDVMADMQPLQKRAYTICLGFSCQELRRMVRVVDSRKRFSVCGEIPHSYIMPDGVSCLVRPKLALKDVLWAIRVMQDDDVVFFIYRRAYPEKRSQLAHREDNSEIVIYGVGEYSAVREADVRQSAKKEPLYHKVCER